MTRVVILFAVLTLVFAALFVADVQGYFNVAQRPVAFLKAGDGTVRRLGMNQLTWDRAQGGTLFGAGDTISTGEDSHAKLVFYAGGELELDSGAMVVLGEDLEQLKLNFLMGSGRVRVAKKAEGKIRVTRANARPKPAVHVASAAKPVAAGAGASAGATTTSGTRTVASLAPSAAASALPLAQASEAPEEMTVADDLLDSDVQVDVVDDLPVPPEPPKQNLDAQAATQPAAQPAAQPTGPASVASSGASKTPSGAAPSRAAGRPAAPAAPADTAIALAPAIQEKAIRHPEQSFSAQGEIMSVAELPPVPEVKYPANDAVISLNQGQVPKLQWELPPPAADESKAPGAQGSKKFSYEIILRPAEGSGEEKVLKSDQPALSLSRIDQGKYLWSVRAVTASGKRGPASQSRWIEIKVPTQIGKPVVLPVQVE